MLNERKLTKAELKKREDIVMDMKKNKRSLTKRYGKDAEAVMYGRATKLAKQKTESMNPDKIREVIKDALQNPEKADLNKDGKLSSYEKKRGAAIEKAMVKEWGGSDQSAMNQSIHRDLGNPTEFPGLSQIMSAAEDAVDFYWDDWDEYQTDRDGLIMSAAQRYARQYFPEFMAKAAKMVEPIDENNEQNSILEPKKLSKGMRITIENDDEDGYFSAGDYTVIGKPKGGFILSGMGHRSLKVTQGELNDVGYTIIVNEARGSNEPFNFSEDEVRAAANLIAKAIAKNDKVKTEVHDFEYDEGRGAGFDISMDGDKSEGGSYSVKPNGDVVNDAIGNSHPNAVYSTIGNKDINVVLANIKKYESGKSAINESKSEAAYELQDIMDQLYELSDRAKQIIRSEFPSEYRRLDAYGALDFGTSRNSYDVTFEKALENLDMEDEDEDMMNEDLDLGHQDDEPGMLKGDLYRIGKYAMELYQMMDDLEGKGEVDFPHWWQSKIVKAKDMVVGAKHYLDFELKEPQIDAMVDVAAEEDVIDENQTKKDILAQIEKLRVASNAGEIDGDEFLDKFMILRDKLKNQTNESVNKNLTVGGKPSQEEVDKFFEETFQETHYLASKPVGEWDEYDMSNWKAKLKKKKQDKPQFGENLTVGGKPSQEELYKVAGRPVTLIKGKKADGTDWKVKFQNGKETPLSDVLSLIKPFPKLDKESVNENLTARIMKTLKETKSKKNR
jgi:hypothetical protein